MNWLLADPPARILCLVAAAALLACLGAALERGDCDRDRAELTALRRQAETLSVERNACQAELADAEVMHVP